MWKDRSACILAWLCFLLMARGGCAQTNSSIAGTVKDATGAVLPGVTVEASSAALIEKVRSAVSDGTGQYKIVQLVPGTYTVTFTGHVVWEMELPGGTTGAPMTYMIGGKQYIVVAVGWRDMPAELIALALE